jgi:glyoxylase-like metal-dependent hydrolase (beta-lactamase superfamily II)
LPAPGRAAVPAAKEQRPGVYRYRLGDTQLTALYDGIWYLPINNKFVRNASGAAVNEALAAALLAPSVLPISFTALLVNTGAKLVLIDTGIAGQITDPAGFMNANLAAAGINPGAIDTILISHFHPDHIDGIKTKDGDKVFANAEILVPEPEWKFWMDDGNMSRATGAVHRYFLNARHLQGHRQGGAAVPARRRGRAQYRLGSRFRPHARPYRLRDPFRQSIDAGDERHRARAVTVRTLPAMAAEL